MLRTDGSGVVPDTVGAATNLVDERLVANVTMHVLDTCIIDGVARLGQNVHGDHALSAAFNQHFHQSLTDKSGRTGHHTVLWHRWKSTVGFGGARVGLR